MLRLAVREVNVPGTDIPVPKGSVVSISPYLTHHNPANFARPDVWDPSRWIDANEELVQIETKGVAGIKYMPFGYGSHRCPGEKMAGIMVTRSLTVLLRDFDLSWASPDQPHSVDFERLDFDKIGSPWLKVRFPVFRPFLVLATYGKFLGRCTSEDLKTRLAEGCD
jgi:sterol 14-demethylase